ncbi:fumarylacetoacetate hydrolase family protein (plasmid) [Rhizobium lusitanum]|uniref:fumarylacetoacetate hydrolase family protein n=1 Tax=Rhizobium lusitanum TaxID=293958 RepID=UPI00160DB52E|nr:fumarylacetoacetate hydrolase family protein [Rhizobium lusitanum]QND46003.1 fumarylacetoacetate hydrolase family protein [Rhizobium lusitanum]
MKLATFRNGNSEQHVAIVLDEGRYLFDLTTASRRHGQDTETFSTMLSLIDAGKRGLDAAASLLDKYGSEEDLSVPTDMVDLQAPLPLPRQMRDGMSFPLHIRQSPRGMRKLYAAENAQLIAEIDAEPLAELPALYRELPIYYITNRMIVGGPGSTVVWPRYSKVMDYELEFGIITMNTAANIKAADAHEHIFGFTIFNDFSARDQQAKEIPGWLGPAKGKSFDGANVIGPWIVTPDEIGDPYSLKAQARVNGEIWSEGTTEGMLFSFEEILAHMSQSETIFAGEFIGSGTLGNGCGLEHGRYLSDGDTVELEFEKIGVLKNKVIRQD